MVRNVMETRVRLMTKEETEKVEGLHTFSMRFLHDGIHRSNELYEYLQVTTLMYLYMKFISRKALEEIGDVSRALAVGKFTIIVKYVRCWHPG